MSLRQLIISTYIYFPIQRWCSQETRSSISPKMATIWRRYQHYGRTSWLHWRQYITPINWELQVTPTCGTSRRWGYHTPWTISNFSKVTNAPQGKRSGNIILWMDKFHLLQGTLNGNLTSIISQYIEKQYKTRRRMMIPPFQILQRQYELRSGLRRMNTMHPRSLARQKLHSHGSSTIMLR